MTTTEQPGAAPPADSPPSLDFSLDDLISGKLTGSDLVRDALAEPGDDAGEQDAAAADAASDTQSAPPAEPEGGEQAPEQQVDPAVQASVAALGYIDAVLQDPEAFSTVPAGLQPIVRGAVESITQGYVQAQRIAEQRGMQLGERMAVLNELFREDRDAFEAEVAKQPGVEAQFYEWRAAIARQAGINGPEQQAILEETGALLNSLDPEWRTVVAQMATDANLKVNRESLDQLKGFVTSVRTFKALGMRPPAAGGAPAEQPAQRPAPQRTAAARVANAERVAGLPKPEVGGNGAGQRPLVDVATLNTPGAGSRLVEAALRG